MEKKLMIKRQICFLLTILSLLFLPAISLAYSFNENFDSKEPLNIIGKGDCYVNNGKLVSREAYATFGEVDWENYHVTFEARTPEWEEQVQIWISFREQSRNERYLVGLKGGFQDDIEIGRMGLMGDDAFLGIRNLDFSPALGEWYTFNIEVCKNRIRIFLNDDVKPLIDVTDKNGQLLPAGRIALGGSWITTEFRNLKVKELPENYLDNVKVDEYSYYLSVQEKEEKRQAERKQYHPITISNLTPTRTEFSLDGEWLFKPGYEITDAKLAISKESEDQDWHTIDVPNFWNPSRIWLHGETFMEERFPKGVSDTYFQRETDRCENYTFDYKKTKVGWYRQWVELPGNIEGKHLELSFDAVSKVAEVFVNGTKAGSNIGMFGSFNVNVTDLVKPGKNLVVVKALRDYVKDIENADEIATIAVTVEVTNQMLKDLPHGFFRDNPSGIWQPVKLIVSEPVKIEDVFIKPSLTGAEFDITVKNNGTKSSTFNIHTSITEQLTKDNLTSEKSLSKLTVKAGEEQIFTYKISDLNPKLWSPTTPNLYDFEFTLSDKKDKKNIDIETITSGFRTFEARGDYLYLNGNRYWLRAANHTPHALGMNDKDLANRTFQLYHEGNIAVTRSHTIPYSKVWLDAADKNGVGVSLEGTWPWLMIGIGEGSIPNEELLKVWSDEWLRLVKKYRNHPSLLYWTNNNEMNFTHHKDDEALLETKMAIVSDVVKKLRKIDPTRPICFDSGYTRHQVAAKPDDSFFEKFDDGDIEDGHNYSGWYHSSIFDNFPGKHFMGRKTPGRPLITQEWSTGYPNTETGHHTRSYLWQHQNTQTHVGNHAYPFGNPKYSLENNAFLTSELVEAVRRTHDEMAGMHNFSSITWFQNVYNAKRVKPYPTYYRMKNSLNPILISAELWGRHFYAGEKLPTKFCIVNDNVDGQTLAPTTLKWEITYKDNRVISSGTYQIPAVKHYAREWLTPEITLPDNFKNGRLDGKLRLFLTQDSKVIAQNEYNLMVAKKEWMQSKVVESKKIIVVDLDKKTNPVLDHLNIASKTASDIKAGLSQKADIYIISGINSYKELSKAEIKLIQHKVKKGAKLMLLNSGKKLTEIFPGFISGYIEKPNETAQIDIPESSVFDGLAHMDLRYFNNNKPEKPMVFNGLIQVHKKSEITSLSAACEHRYARIQDRRKEMLTMKGFPIISFENGGKVILSEMMTDKGLFDPVAAKLLVNMLGNL